MGKNTRHPGSIYFDRKHLRSEAFRGLTRVSLLVYFDFLGKRQMHPGKAKTGRDNEWIIKNNGEIVYTYKEAVGRDISRSSFRNALDQLIERGFIDIVHQGNGGRKGDVTLYAVSDRWEQYGTDDFQKHPERAVDKRKGRGWAVIMADPKRRKQVLRKRAGQKSSVFKRTLQKGRLGVENNTPNSRKGTHSSVENNTPKKRKKAETS